MLFHQKYQLYRSFTTMQSSLEIFLCSKIESQVVKSVYNTIFKSSCLARSQNQLITLNIPTLPYLASNNPQMNFSYDLSHITSFLVRGGH